MDGNNDGEVVAMALGNCIPRNEEVYDISTNTPYWYVRYT